MRSAKISDSRFLTLDLAHGTDDSYDAYNYQLNFFELTLNLTPVSHLSWTWLLLQSNLHLINPGLVSCYKAFEE